MALLSESSGSRSRSGRRVPPVARIIGIVALVLVAMTAKIAAFLAENLARS
jgi:hypothetical protein